MTDATEAKLPEHSPLGASGASRWMKCPGSVGLSVGCEDEESEFAAEGTAAHELGEMCLASGKDAWEYIGDFSVTKDATQEVTKDMADAVQVYLDDIRTSHPDRDQSNSFIERGFYCPSIHKWFYGRSDHTYIDLGARVMHVRDYKHGAGIVVEVKENPQGMYYAVGMLEDLDLWDKIDKVVIHICQPRGFHFDGPLREWAISTKDLKVWLNEVLLPAMDVAMVSRETNSGEHCRFCSARSYGCPQLLKDFDELEKLMTEATDKGGAQKLSNAQIGRFLTLFDVAKIVAKAASKTAFGRLSAGKKIPGRKLANSRTNREWKAEAEAAIKAKFGDKAMTDPELKSPAQIEALPEGKAYSTRYAFKPEGGLTVVPGTDTRAEVSRDTKSLFKDQTKKGKK